MSKSLWQWEELSMLSFTNTDDSSDSTISESDDDEPAAETKHTYTSCYWLAQARCLLTDWGSLHKH